MKVSETLTLAMSSIGFPPHPFLLLLKTWLNILSPPDQAAPVPDRDWRYPFITYSIFTGVSSKRSQHVFCPWWAFL